MKRKFRSFLQNLARLSPHNIVLLILIISILYILIVEIGHFQENSVLLSVLLKLAYSFSAISIFYYVTQYLPKEELKVITYRHTHNKMVTLITEIEGILKDFDIKKDAPIDRFQEVFENVNPDDKITSTFRSYDNWCRYLDFKTTTLRKLVSESLLHQGYLDIEVLELLYNIDDSISNFMIRSSPEHIARPLFNIADYAYELSNILLSDKMTKYGKQSANRYRKEKVRHIERQANNQ